MKILLFEPDYIGNLREENVLLHNKRVFLEFLRKYEEFLENSLVITPELFLGRMVENVVDTIYSNFKRNFILIVGGVRVINGKLYNVAVVSDGKRKYFHRKYHLWKGEEEFFLKGEGPSIIKFPECSIAIFICSDIVDPRYEKLYGVPYDKGSLDKLKSKISLAVVLSASYYKGLDVWERSLKEISIKYFPVAYCNWRNVFKYSNNEYGGDRSGLFVNGRLIEPILYERHDKYSVKLYKFSGTNI